MTPVTNHFFDMQELSNDDLDNAPMTWDAIATYVLVTINAMVTLVLVLIALAYALGVL